MNSNRSNDQSQRGALRLLFDFSEAISCQREALALRDWTKLQGSIQALQVAMSQIANFPGGAEGVRQQLLETEGKTKDAANQLIEKVMIERKSSAELIRLQLQRLQALKTITALEEDSATYTESGANKGKSIHLSTWA